MLAIVHTSKKSLPTRQKLAKTLAKIEANSIFRQQFANVFSDCFCAVHTHQHEFANTSWPTLVGSVKAALVLHCASLLRTIFTPLARAHERVHEQNVRDFPQTNLDSEIILFSSTSTVTPNFFFRYLPTTV